MTPDPCAVDEGLTLADAADRMMANDIRHLLVLRGDRLTGAVSQADVTLGSQLRGEEAKVAVATRPSHICSPDEPVTDVASLMERHLYETAAVVSGGQVVGIFTVSDALRALRQVVLGTAVEPEIKASHRPELPAEREQVLPEVRVKRMLRRRGASPSPNDGRVLGSVL